MTRRTTVRVRVWFHWLALHHVRIGWIKKGVLAYSLPLSLSVLIGQTWLIYIYPHSLYWWRDPPFSGQRDPLQSNQRQSPSASLSLEDRTKYDIWTTYLPTRSHNDVNCKQESITVGVFWYSRISHNFPELQKFLSLEIIFQIVMTFPGFLWPLGDPSKGQEITACWYLFVCPSRMVYEFLCSRRQVEGLLLVPPASSWPSYRSLSCRQGTESEERVSSHPPIRLIAHPEGQVGHTQILTISEMTAHRKMYHYHGNQIKMKNNCVFFLHVVPTWTYKRLSNKTRDLIGTLR